MPHNNIMDLDVISHFDLLASDSQALKQLEKALLCKGIVGISHVPEFENKTRQYIDAARAFSALEAGIKQRYAPNRDAGDTEGYELGAERFKDLDGNWQIDDKKASFYAFVPENSRNKWPLEVDLKTPYLALGELIFKTGKLLLQVMGLDHTVGINHDALEGYGRMLHYYKEGTATNLQQDWCGAHFDHGLFTGLVPAYYFQNGIEVPEPEEAGLYIKPTNGNHFEKIGATDKSILLFQVGEFGQLVSNDRIRATKHCVKKSALGIERFTFALFYSAGDKVEIQSTSELKNDLRYQLNQSANGRITYERWQTASFERYRAK